MKLKIIQSLTDNFESCAKQTENGVEFWLARDLQYLLGYEKWDNFKSVIYKAKTACEVSGRTVSDHFPDVGKMVNLGSDSQREVEDLRKNTSERCGEIPNNRVMYECRK